MNKDDSNFIRNKADAVDYVSAPACAQSCTTQEAPLDAAMPLLQDSSAVDMARKIIAGRNEGFRTFPALGLVELSKRSPELFKAAFPEVIKDGDDLADFIAFCRARRGIGRAVKAAITKWLDNNAKPHYAQKYRRQLADAARLVRYRGDKDPVWGYIFAYYKDRMKTWTPAKLQAALDKYPELNAHDDFVDAVNNGTVDEAVEAPRRDLGGD